MRNKGFEDMPIWQNAMNIAISVHMVSEGFQKKEDYAVK
ncbi:MAG: four helix bundle protein [Deltaproteobacteria bacterium]|nr:four helix bundle protein [Deltaproteobacteria bacterium]